MHRSAWMWAGLLAAAVCPGVAPAQTSVGPVPPINIGSAKGWAPACDTPPRPYCPSPAAPSAATPSPTPSPTPTPETPAPAPTESPTGTSEFRTFGQTNLVQANLALAGSGTSATSAAASTGVGGVTTLSSFSVVTPTILPGLLTAASVQSARPMDRVFFAYSYLDRFQVVTGGVPLPPALTAGAATAAAVAASPTVRQPGFNLNMYYLGAEKTFFDGMASVYILAPFLQATDNITSQPIDGFGNLSVGLKAVLLGDARSGSLLSGGFTASLPTGHNTTYLTSQVTTITTPATALSTTFASTASTNPTYLQPWLAGLLAGDRVFVQEYFGVIIPTDSVVATFINNDITMGFRAYRGEPGSFLSFVTPVVDLQALLPVNHIGSATSTATNIVAANVANGGAAIIPPTPIAGSNNLTFSNQLFLTSGVQVGLGNRTVFSTGIITPLAGPKAFNWGVTAGLNFFY